MSEFGLYIDVKRTPTIVVTRLCEGVLRDGTYHVQTDDQTGRLDVRCLAHNVVVRGITPAQAESVEDALAFCPHCLSGQPAIQRQPDPLVEMLRGMLDEARGCEDDDQDDDDGGDDDEPVAPPMKRNVFAEFINSL
jgi:hypothetical protein